MRPVDVRLGLLPWCLDPSVSMPVPDHHRPPPVASVWTSLIINRAVVHAMSFSNSHAPPDRTTGGCWYWIPSPHSPVDIPLISPLIESLNYLISHVFFCLDDLQPLLGGLCFVRFRPLFFFLLLLLQARAQEFGPRYSFILNQCSSHMVQSFSTCCNHFVS